MEPTKQEALEKAGFILEDFHDFLNLTDVEKVEVLIRVYGDGLIINRSLERVEPPKAGYAVALRQFNDLDEAISIYFEEFSDDKFIGYYTGVDDGRPYYVITAIYENMMSAFLAAKTVSNRFVYDFSTDNLIEL